METKHSFKTSISNNLGMMVISFDFSFTLICPKLKPLALTDELHV
ncbi:MAG: hypothetical protein QM751_04110 [Paludibacteraceae bacterium]